MQTLDRQKTADIIDMWLACFFLFSSLTFAESLVLPSGNQLVFNNSEFSVTDGSTTFSAPAILISAKKYPKLNAVLVTEFKPEKFKDKILDSNWCQHEKISESLCLQKIISTYEKSYVITAKSPVRKNKTVQVYHSLTFTTNKKNSADEKDILSTFTKLMRDLKWKS